MSNKKSDFWDKINTLSISPTNATAQEILDQRARNLAREKDEKTDAGESLEVVKFSFGQEKYAIETAFIGEVLALEEITPLPCTPIFVLGIILVRGQIVSVVDFQQFLGITRKGLRDLKQTIVLTCAEMEIAILVDEIIGVCSIPLADIQQPFSYDANFAPGYIMGITNEPLIIFSAAKILADERLVIEEEV